MVDLPEPAYRGSTSARCIEDVLRPREPSYEYLFMPGQETLGHFYIPPFQRPPRWTPTQSQRLVESVFLGISIGSIVVSDCGNATRTVVDGKTVERFPDSADWLIDGQQRLRALRAYMQEGMRVFVGTPHEHAYAELSRPQQRRFAGTPIGYIQLEAMPVEDLARVYDLLNYGGTPHRESERASAQPTG